MTHRKSLALIGALVFIGLMVSPLRVLAAQLLGSEFIIANHFDNTTPLQEVTPSVAYNSRRNFYLVVWRNDRPDNDDIRAQKVAEDGSLMGGPFYISGGPGHDRWKPDITYDSVNDQFLVVWEDWDPNISDPGYSIRGKRVSGTGMVLDSNDLIIRAKNITFYTPSEPAVAFSTFSNRYMVVWHEVSHVGKIIQNINCQVIRPDGSLEGAVKSIPGSTKRHSAPGLAYIPGVHRYMVAWQEYNSTTTYADVKGQQVWGDGNLWGSTNTYSNSGIEYQGPVVAVLPNARGDKVIAIAWAYDDGFWNGYGSVFTNQDGVLKGQSFAYWSNSTYAFKNMAIVANQRSNTYHFAIQWVKGIMDKSISIKHNDLLFPFSWEDSLSIPGTSNDFPALAVGPAGDVLVAWQGQPLSATSKNIYGQIIEYHPLIYVPLIKR